MLVIPAADFRRLSELSTANGRPVYEMAFAMNLETHSRWHPWMVPSGRLAERFGVSLSESVTAVSEEGAPFASSDRGFFVGLGVMRPLAPAHDLQLFLAFSHSSTA